MVARLIYGFRISVLFGLVLTFFSSIIGIIAGAVQGYYGGKIDVIICWLINVVWSIPTLLLVIAISVVLGKGFWQVFVAVGLTMWVEVARVVRGQIFQIRELEYIESGKVLGYSSFRIDQRNSGGNYHKWR